MPAPETVRRIKTYSSANAVVYQYQFYEVLPVKKASGQGNLYKYYVSVDRKTMFTIQVSVEPSASEEYKKRFGRAISGTEEYAVAKMRLFKAFDEVEDLAKNRPELIVDASNIETLLEQLDL